MQTDNNINNTTDNTEALPKHNKIIFLIIAFLIALVVLPLSIICFNAPTYTSHFFPNTYVNGVNVSDMSAEEAKAVLQSAIDNYSIIIKARDRDDETITGTDVGLTMVFDDTLDDAILSQNSSLWFLNMFKNTEYSLQTMCSVDDKLFDEATDKLSCFDASSSASPTNATISSYSDAGYSIVPGEKGNVIADKDGVKEYIKEAVLSLDDSVDIDYEGNVFYLQPAMDGTEDRLSSVIDILNTYTKTKIHYTDTDITLAGDSISKWLTTDEEYNVLVDQEGIAEYVAELAKKIDTSYKPKNLKTSYGSTVTITGGSYGWKIDQAKESEKISEEIKTGSEIEREPEYARKAASHTEPDYGNTYVEINLTAQHLYYYKNGSLVIESDFVSGNLSRGFGTPGGAYALAYKQRNAILRGQGYASPVSYWMPFNNGIGLHDANWRSSFGGAIYKTNGSHGCINLPPSVAKTIFENIEAGCPVLCYFLDGTESSKTSSKTGTDTGAATTQAATQPAPVETTQAETQASAPESTAVVTPQTGVNGGPGVTAAETKPQEETQIQTEAQPQTETLTPAQTGVNGGPGV